MTDDEAAALTAALQPFLDDLRRQHPHLLRVRVEAEHLLLTGTDGSGTGIPLDWLHAPDPLVMISDGAHEAAIDALWTAGLSTSWPECPEHPGGHPLQVSPGGDGPVWACPKSGRVVSRVGSLPTG